MKKFKDVFCGLLISVALCALAVLMSGAIVGGDVLEMYDTKCFVFGFPLLFAVAICFVAKFARDKGRNALYISTVAFSVAPIGLALVGGIFSAFGLSVLPFFLTVPAIPLLSAFNKFNEMFSIITTENSFSGNVVVALVLHSVPLVAGIIISAIISRRKIEIV